MKKIKLRVSGNVAEITECPEIITSGTVGLPVEFAFDESWEDLNRLAVFRAGDMTLTVEEPAVVPWEVLETPNVWLKIGVYGVNADGTVVIPTLWANVCVIHTGANPDGESAAAPTLTVGQKLLSEVSGIAAGAAAAAAAVDSHISNGENPHGVTAEQIGAAPSGFGLGEASSVLTQWDSISANGFYRAHTDSPDGRYWYGLHCNEDGKHMTQIAFRRQVVAGKPAVWAIRQKNVDSGFEPWEYVNPPYKEGVEYLTIEQWGEKALYKKMENGIVYQRIDGQTEWQEVPSPKTIVDTYNPWDYADILTATFPTADFYWHKYLDGTAVVYFMAQFPTEYGSVSTDNPFTIRLPFPLKNAGISVENYVEDERSTVYCGANQEDMNGWGVTEFDVHILFENPDQDSLELDAIVDCVITITGRWK